MFTKTNVEVVPLTLELAEAHNALQPLPGERELRQARTGFLLNKVKAGHFIGTEWAIGKEVSTGRTYRLDGQHSSHLLANLPPDVTFPKDGVATITTYEFDSVYQDSPMLFDLFNNPASVRSNEDVIGLYRAGHAELAGLSRKFLLKVTNGIAAYETGRFQRGATDSMVWLPRARGMYFTNPRYVAAALWLASFVDTKNDDFLSKPPIVAEMIERWLLEPKTAEEFWRYVFTEGHPEPDDITRTLADTYRQWSQAQKKHKPEQYRQKAAIAWKHYVREQKAVAAA